MHQLGACQDRVRSHDFLSIDSAEGSREQTKLLDEHNIVVNQDQVPDVEHMRGENEDELERQLW